MDAVLVAAFDRLVGWLQQACGFSLPAILREATAAVGLSMALAAVALLAALLGWLVSSRWRRLDRDAKRDWTPELARAYLARAEVCRSRDALVRIALTTFAVVNAVQFLHSALVEGLPGSVAAIIPFQAATVADLYLSCAHPRDPGSRVRKGSRLAHGAA